MSSNYDKLKDLNQNSSSTSTGLSSDKQLLTQNTSLERSQTTTENENIAYSNENNEVVGIDNLIKYEMNDCTEMTTVTNSSNSGDGVCEPEIEEFSKLPSTTFNLTINSHDLVPLSSSTNQNSPIEKDSITRLQSNGQHQQHSIITIQSSNNNNNQLESPSKISYPSPRPSANSSNAGNQNQKLLTKKKDERFPSYNNTENEKENILNREKEDFEALSNQILAKTDLSKSRQDILAELRKSNEALTQGVEPDVKIEDLKASCQDLIFCLLCAGLMGVLVHILVEFA